MKTKALKKRLGLQVLLNLEEVFTQESPRAAKYMRKSLKSIAKSLVKEFMKRSKSLEKLDQKKRSAEGETIKVKRTKAATTKLAPKVTPVSRKSKTAKKK